MYIASYLGSYIKEAAMETNGLITSYTFLPRNLKIIFELPTYCSINKLVKLLWQTSFVVDVWIGYMPFICMVSLIIINQGISCNVLPQSKY